MIPTATRVYEAQRRLFARSRRIPATPAAISAGNNMECATCDVRWHSRAGTACFCCGQEGVDR